jgi:enoyl-CoA hydratase
VRFTPAINRTFSAPSVEEILVRLDAERGEDEVWARETAITLREKSPTSLKVAFAQMQRGKSLDLADALRLEFRLASHLVSRPDYREGIAARIAGKGRAPQWSPDTLAAVDDSDIERMFTTPVEDELMLSETAQNNQQ